MMKKWDFRNIQLKKVDISDLNDRSLLLNLYFTQTLSLIIALIITLFQRHRFWTFFSTDGGWKIVYWGIGLAIAVLLVDFAVGRWVPEEVTDDGGVNKRIFGQRPLWHIACISAVVAVCEEMLFRGAIQASWGAYWTSILFAAIHIRYLRHWLMTGLVFSISYGLGWVYVHTGTLWTPIIAHFTIDFVLGVILKYSKEDR
jgi:uncharacterized protein